MAFNGQETLDLARQLQTTTPPGVSDEAARRCAVSRAYFAAFGHAIRYAVAYLGFEPREAADDHGRLKAHLKQKRRAGVSARLDQLRGWRNQCDYDDDAGDLVVMLAAAITAAEYVFAALPPPAPRQTS